MIDVEIDARQLKRLQKDFLKLKPSQMRAIVREVLNDEAFESRREVIEKSIPGMFHNRSKWVASSILVDKAKGKDVSKMVAIMGAKKTWRRNPGRAFLGMAEQETGSTIKNPGIETALARSGGKFAGRVLKSAKLTSLQPIVSESDYGHGMGAVIAMLRTLERQNHKGGIRISRNYSKIKKGVYRFKGRTMKFSDGKRHKPIQMVMDTSRKTVRTKRRPWMRKGVRNAITKTFIIRSFRKNYRRFTTRR